VLARVGGRRRLSPHRLAEFDGLAHLSVARGDVGVVDAHRVVLVLVPAGADAQDGATARDVVETRHDAPEIGGVAVVRAGHERAQVHRVGLAGNGREGGVTLQEGLVALADEGELPDVVHDREPREPLGFEPLRAVDGRLDGWSVVVGIVKTRVVVANVHVGGADAGHYKVGPSSLSFGDLDGEYATGLSVVWRSRRSHGGRHWWV